MKKRSGYSSSIVCRGAIQQNPASFAIPATATAISGGGGSGRGRGLRSVWHDASWSAQPGMSRDDY